jgi:polar amino acid transport system substrate-binding protein
VLDMINYWSEGSSLGVKVGNPESLGINNTSVCGKSIAVMTGTTQQETYLPLISKSCTSAGKPAVNAVTLPNVNTALTELASGRIDGIFYDTSSLAYAVQQHGSAFTLTQPQYAKPASLGNDLVTIGLAKDSPLTKAVQAAMQSVIDSPLYLKALNDWDLGAGAIKTASIATSTSN